MSTPTDILFLDTGSTRMSVAVSRGEAVAQRRAEVERSSEALIELVEAVLDDAGLTVDRLQGLVALQGPGSFTGLRVGLAAALALHQALDIPATALPTLEALSHCADHFPALSVADAQRGAWYRQPFGGAGSPTGPAERATETTAPPPARCVVGYGAERFATRSASPVPELVLDIDNVAGWIARRYPPASLRWEPARLTDPLYLGPAATTPPRRPPPGS